MNDNLIEIYINALKYNIRLSVKPSIYNNGCFRVKFDRIRLGDFISSYLGPVNIDPSSLLNEFWNL